MGPSQSDLLNVSPQKGADYVGIEIPESLAARTRVLLDLDRAPRTLGDLGEVFRTTSTFSTTNGHTWQDLLISEKPTAHEVRIGENTYYTYCILDALVLPFLHDRRVEIQSRPPKGAQVIEIAATPHRLEATPAGTVVSFGASLSTPSTPDQLIDNDPDNLLDLTHTMGCPTINAFPDKASYESWNREGKAVTVLMTLAQAYTMAHDSAHNLTNP